ncbi:MAG: ABC transporter ATP-binding protein [Lachnospiraceae bacterium]|nr:ABC transporter ATP-binding protein [Lachnospiraceae bacterium]
MTEKNIVLEIKHLKKAFYDNGFEEEIVADFNLQVEKNEFLCILGPSGCGKTTLLRCIAGFEKYQGEILVNGQLKKEPGVDRIMVFQDFNQLFPWKTVEKNIQYPLKQQGIRDKKELDRITAEYLAKVNLNGIQKKYPHQLSGGMKQRVAIAKALALKPQIILMDEPFAALDAMTRNKLLAEVLLISQNEDCTFIFITHNIQEAIVLGSRVMVLASKGEVKIDEKNTIEKPVTPASEGYGNLWKRLHDALEDESAQEQ